MTDTNSVVERLQEEQKLNKSKVFADKNSYDGLIKKYSSVAGVIQKFIENKCKFYSTKTQKELESQKNGFENGQKYEFIEAVKDYILLIQEDYKPEKQQEKKKKKQGIAIEISREEYLEA